MSIYRKRRLTSLQERFTPSTIKEVATAQLEGRDAHYHGGCTGCVFKPNNTSQQGIMHCLGCMFMQWDHTLPNLRVGP